ncbi:MAG: FHA domain-containing protein [Alphaproteobacteria bacterium]|nr:FHA domain-containing protein [Alphaproteobacteria bacterium]
MSTGMQLYFVSEGEEILALGLGRRPVHVGRAPDNDLVLPDATISAHHATLWVEAGRAWVRDRGSKNGTFVNSDRVRGPNPLEDGDVVRFGTGSKLIARGQIAAPAGQPAVPLVVEDMDTGLKYPVVGGRFTIGSSEFANIPLDPDAEDEVALSVTPDGEIWRASMDEEGPLAIEEPFPVGARRFRVIPLPPAPTGTVDVGPSRFRYRLLCTLDGVSGAEAVIEDPSNGRRYTVEAENRAILLYLLARHQTDARATDDFEAQSWCADDEVSKGIWGRKGTSDANSLHVLVHRLRKELKKAGFDPWFLEKRRKAIRLALDDVTVR